MWAGEPFLFHSRLSAAMNLKLLDPREVLRGAEDAWKTGAAPLDAVEGFIRQVLGWREYVRGIYGLRMPGYLEENALGRPSAAGVLLDRRDRDGLPRRRPPPDARLGYAHHIQRLMVTGLYALLLGVDPDAVHHWYLAVYVDAVEWVELPNILGMSQHADGGFMASKPYVATGKYIQRMTNHCRSCRFDPAKSTGDGLPLHDALLGLPRASPGLSREERADAPAGEEPRSAPRGDPARDPPVSRVVGCRRR